MLPGSASRDIGEALLHPSKEEGRAIVSSMLTSGIDVDALCEIMIPDAARRLGDGWTDDRLTFTDVSIGTAHLQAIYRGLEIRYEQRQSNRPVGLGTMLMVVPGTEDHTLGALIAASQFRKLGYSVEFAMAKAPREVEKMVLETNPAIVGVSVGSRRSIASLHEIVQRARDVTDRLTLAAGGAFTLVDPGALDATGVDVVSNDPAEAVAYATAPASISCESTP